MTMIKDFCDLTKYLIQTKQKMHLLNDKLVQIRSLEIELMVMMEHGDSKVFELIEQKEKAIHEIMHVIPHLNESFETFETQFKQISERLDNN